MGKALEKHPELKTLEDEYMQAAKETDKIQDQIDEIDNRLQEAEEAAE